MFKIIITHLVAAIVTLILIYMFLCFAGIDKQRFVSAGWNTKIITGNSLLLMVTLWVLVATMISNVIFNLILNTVNKK